MSSSTVPKTVILNGCPPVYEGVAATSSNIKPGMLIERTSSDTLRPHTTSPGRAAPLFAREMDLAGGTIDDVYDNADTVQYVHAQPGDQIYALLQAGDDVAIGQHLQSAGDGSLEAIDSDGHAVAVALEAVDNNPGSGGLPVRIKVEVI